MADNRTKLSEALKAFVPLQVRTIASTVAGNKGDITQKDLSIEDLNQLNDLIEKSREGRMLRVAPKDAAVFNKGGGYVDYDGYNDANQMVSDWNMGQQGALKNTIGQFRYETLPNGNIRVKDRYDFANDNPGVLPKEVANSARYEGMNPLAKALLLAKETIKMPGHDVNIGLGLGTFPSRFGNAFVGKDGRNVNIEFTPRNPLKTLQQMRSPEDDLDMPVR